jgi:CRP-like cAMP-binding protein
VTEPPLPDLVHVLQARGLDDCACVDLAAGQDLVGRGERGSDAYWVESGSLAAVAEDGSTLARLSAGSLTGEFVALVGGERTATLRAVEPTQVRVIPAQMLEALLAGDPALADVVRSEAVRRILQTQLQRVLAGVLGPGGASIAGAVAPRGTLRRVAAGEMIFDAGDLAASAFVVVSGRLRRRTVADEHQMLGYVGVGSVVGEEGLTPGQRRRVALDAVRDCVLWEVDASGFRDLLVAHPSEVGPMALRLGIGGNAPHREVDRTVAVAVTADVDAQALIAGLVDQMTVLGPTTHLTSQRVDDLLDRPGVGQSRDGDPGEIRLLELMARVEYESQ